MVTHQTRIIALTGLAFAGALAASLIVAQPAAAGGAAAPVASSQSVMRSTGRAVDRAIQNSLRHQRQSAVLADRASEEKPTPQASDRPQSNDGAAASGTPIPQD